MLGERLAGQFKQRVGFGGAKLRPPAPPFDDSGVALLIGWSIKDVRQVEDIKLLRIAF